jgi:NADH dehydrogenase [ubiquinone] 1 alpha subcomplex assembly factor 5
MADIFDIEALKHKRDLAAHNKSYKDHFLLKYISQNLEERFDSLGLEFDDILLIGLMSDDLIKVLARKANHKLSITDLSTKLIANYPEFQSINYQNETIQTQQQFDLIFSFLDLHHINKIPEHLSSIKKILKPNGIFMGCFFGEENLKNLRQSFLATEAFISSPKFFPFIEIKTAGNILQKAGFAEPITDLDRINIEYSKLKTLCKDIQDICETNILVKRNNFLADRNFINKTESLLLSNAKKFDIEIQIINFICYNKAMKST